MLMRLNSLKEWAVSALTGDDDDDDDDEEEDSAERPPRDPIYARDVVVPLDRDPRSAPRESSSADSDSLGSDILGSSDDDDGPAYQMPVPLRDKHYSVLAESGYWTGEAGAERLRYALDVYARFRQYAPLGRAPHQHAYNEVDLVGLEYLVADVGRRRYDALPFSDICLNGDEPAIAFPLEQRCLDTFIVCRTHDYLYGRLIEDALLQPAERRRLPPGLLEASRAHWLCRLQRFPLCRATRCLAKRDLDLKACRHQWVIYTRTDSAFYTFCDTHRVQNRYVDYDRHDGGSPAQLHISYHLVNFLCGPLLSPPPESGVGQYDEWVVQSIEMLDLWNTRGYVELNRNSTFAGGEPRPLDAGLWIQPADLL
jgi:hypothetical protein